MTKHQFHNLYSFSFKVDNVEYGQWLDSVKIKKDVTGNKFVEDTFIFKKDATDLLNMMLQPANIEISINRSNSYEPIMRVSGIISKVFMKDDKIILFFESDQKINWMRKNGVSITCEQCTVKDALQKYIDKIDSFYKHKSKTLFFINYEKNINKHKYENILIPIQNNHFETFEKIARTYFLVNAPFYLFIDDYNFTDVNHPVSMNVYDLSDIKSLRAVMVKDLNTSTRPLFKSSGTYYDSKVYYNVTNMQKFNHTVYSYTSLKNINKLDPKNRFKYNDVPDTIKAAENRQQLAKDFFSKAAQFYKYEIQDIDVTKFQLGYRFVDDTSSTRIQYAQAIVDVEYKFLTSGTQDTIENKDEFVNQMTVFVKFTTISN